MLFMSLRRIASLILANLCILTFSQLHDLGPELAGPGHPGLEHVSTTSILRVSEAKEETPCAWDHPRSRSVTQYYQRVVRVAAFAELIGGQQSRLANFSRCLHGSSLDLNDPWGPSVLEEIQELSEDVTDFIKYTEMYETSLRSLKSLGNPMTQTIFDYSLDTFTLWRTILRSHAVGGNKKRLSEYLKAVGEELEFLGVVIERLMDSAELIKFHINLIRIYALLSPKLGVGTRMTHIQVTKEQILDAIVGLASETDGCLSLMRGTDQGLESYDDDMNTIKTNVFSLLSRLCDQLLYEAKKSVESIDCRKEELYRISGAFGHPCRASQSDLMENLRYLNEQFDYPEKAAEVLKGEEHPRSSELVERYVRAHEIHHIVNENWGSINLTEFICTAKDVENAFLELEMWYELGNGHDELDEYHFRKLRAGLRSLVEISQSYCGKVSEVVSFGTAFQELIRYHGGSQVYPPPWYQYHWSHLFEHKTSRSYPETVLREFREALTQVHIKLDIFRFLLQKTRSHASLVLRIRNGYPSLALRTKGGSGRRDFSSYLKETNLEWHTLWEKSTSAFDTILQEVSRRIYALSYLTKEIGNGKAALLIRADSSLRTIPESERLELEKAVGTALNLLLTCPGMEASLEFA
ncbi:hypothetical protein SCHPADRAFT_1003337 [Schizopora paradoxa]|uniref:Uncharacterized protein n=1 Tax=Schizopora paradoxa TaxID=27342 RepID=A0A0H2QXF1_9AGAM|nr:hypothetical protein SCHPADRAFT_1003337 [Schizopora paradoxa]